MATDSGLRLGKRIVYIHHSRSSESSVDIGRGVEEAARILGCDVTVLDPDFDQEQRRRCVEEAIRSEPDLVVAAVVSPALLPELFDEIADRGIPWIEAAARQQWHRGLAAQAVPDDEAMTALLDEWILARLVERHGADAALELGAWVATALGEGLRQRDDRRAADLRDSAHVREVFTHDIDLVNLQDDIRSSTLAALERHPALAALWQTCEPCGAAQAKVLNDLGRFGDERPILAGFYSNPVTRRLVAAGEVDALVQVDTRVQGLAAVDLAVRHWFSGEPWTEGENALAPFAEAWGRPWIITPDTVGDDPRALRVPGADPIAFFAERWTSAARTRATDTDSRLPSGGEETK